MADDQKPNEETSEEQTSEEQQGPDEGINAASGGPVAEEESSSSQAAGDDPSSTPPAGEVPEVAPSEDSEEEPAEKEQAETASESDAEKPDKAEKKEAIPGADLEPIAVEQEARPLSAEEKARLEAEAEERARREAALEGDSDEDSKPASRAPAKLEGDARFLATGKRKRAIARVILLPGSGTIEVNGRPLEEFFPRPLHQTIARQPLSTAGYEGSVDVRVRVHGGGVGGQAGAVRHGIARALIEVDPELRGELKRRGLLTRDSRVKERRKAGLKKARKRPQFSKR